MRFASAIALLGAVACAACKFPELPPIEPDAPGDGADAPSDSGVDAAGLPAFDVAYPEEWRFSVAGPATAFLLVVNTGPSPLSLSTFQVASISDNHETAVVRVTSPVSFTDVLQPNTAGGQLTAASQQLLVGNGLVTEPVTAPDADLLSLELINAPPGTYDIAVNLSVELDGVVAAMPMTIHVVPGPIVYLDPLVGRRTMWFR